MKKLLLTGVLLVSISCLFAQKTDDSALLKKLVEKKVLTEEEAKEISAETNQESKSTLAESVEKIRSGFNTPYMKFGGYGLFLYKYNDLARVKHDVEPRVVFLNVGGNLTNNLSYFLMAELVNPLLHEFYLDWAPAKELKFRAGQFKVPFSLENQISLTNLETVMYSRTISSLVGMTDDVQKLQSGRNNGGRDVGIQASGSLIPMERNDLIQYAVGVFQGSGIIASEQNNSKDFSGTVMLQPIKGFKIGGGAYFGEATYLNVGETVAKDHVRNRWAISSEYQSDRFNARAEWIMGNDAGISKEGVYGIASYYFLPKKLNALARVDYFNKNKDFNQEVFDYTVGLNYYFYPQCRFQVNYTYSDYSRAWGDRDSNTVYAQLQIVF